MAQPAAARIQGIEPDFLAQVVSSARLFNVVAVTTSFEPVSRVDSEFETELVSESSEKWAP